jgi:hypothetical protein
MTVKMPGATVTSLASWEGFEPDVAVVKQDGAGTSRASRDSTVGRGGRRRPELLGPLRSQFDKVRDNMIRSSRADLIYCGRSVISLGRAFMFDPVGGSGTCGGSKGFDLPNRQEIEADRKRWILLPWGILSGMSIGSICRQP